MNGRWKIKKKKGFIAWANYEELSRNKKDNWVQSFVFDLGSQGGLAVINRVSQQVQSCPGVTCRLSFSQSQSDSEGSSPGTAPVFLPRQNRLSVNYIRLQ